MSKPDASRRLSRATPPAWLALALALALAAAPAAAAPFGADPEQAAALLEQLGDRYDVLTLTDSYLLQPADPQAGYRAIEVKAGSVAIDGEPVDPAELEERLGDDAAVVLALSELGSAEWSATEELRRRIERLAGERRLKAEEIEELVRSRLEELESLKEEHLQVIEEALEEQRRAAREGRVRGTVRTDTRVSFGSGLKVEENELSRDVVVLGGSLDVEGRVRGDAVVVGGSAEIRGEVSGTVTAVGGSISLGPGAVIRGDAISIGGAVHRDPTAEVYGEITEVSLGPDFEIEDIWDWDGFPGWHVGWFDFGFAELFVRVGKTVVLGVMLALLLLLFPRLIGAVADRAALEPWKAGIVGLGTQLLFLFALPVVCIILLITIIGIPLALILAPLATLALVVLYLLGFAGAAVAAGRLLQARFAWREASPYLLMVFGLLLIQGWSILGEALGFLGGPIGFLAWLVLLLGFLIKYVAWTTGLGAILLHYVSPLPAGAAPRGAPPLPPPPPGPPRGWEDTRVDVETAAPDTLRQLRDASGAAPGEPTETVDEDEPYLRAGDRSAPQDDAAAEEEGSDGDAEDTQPKDEGSDEKGEKPPG